MLLRAPHFKSSSKYFTKILKFSVKLWFNDFLILYQFSRRLRKNLPISSHLPLFNKDLHMKFGPIFIVSQKFMSQWKKKKKTSTTFDLDVILTGVFLKRKVLFFASVSVEKVELHAFYRVQQCFKQ